MVGLGIGVVGGVLPTVVLLGVGAHNHRAMGGLAAVAGLVGLVVLGAAGWALFGDGQVRPPRARTVVAGAAAVTVSVVIGIAAVVGLGLLFWFGMRQLFVAIGHAIVDAIKHSLHGSARR